MPEAEDETIREILFRDYRIIYRVKTDHVEILGVIHGARDLGGAKAKPWDLA